MLLSSIIVNMAILPFAAIALLTRRDAILPSQREHYDQVMSTIAPNQFVDFYRSRELIKLNIYELPTGQIIRRERFQGSADAGAYFEQQRELENKVLREYCEQEYCGQKKNVEEE